MSGGLTGFAFHRLVQVPASGPEETDTGTDGLRAALVAAHAELTAPVSPDTADEPDAAGAPVIAWLWHRPCAGGPVRVLLGGRPHFPAATAAEAPDGRPVPVLYPPGAAGLPVDSRSVEEELDRFPVWHRCLGHVDSLWTEENRPRPGRRTPRFAAYVAHSREPFAWLVTARPVLPADLDAELRSLASTVPALRQRQNSQRDRVALTRAEERYKELARERAQGTWRVRVAVGGTTPVTARRTAALLCAAGDLDALPYRLTPHPTPVRYADLDTPAVEESDDAASPFHATSALLAALTEPPRREIPGIRVVEPPDFDVTPEYSGGLLVGHVLDNADQRAGEFGVSTATLNRHVLVAGATGSGKSQTVRHLLESVHAEGVPWLVVEPAKAEYARMAGRIGGDRVAVLRPGDPDAPPLGINPLEPSPGFPLSTHIDLVRALFLAAFQANEPFPQVLSAALGSVYAAQGWDTVLGTPRRPGIRPGYPVLGDLQRTAKEVVAGIGYGKEITSNVQGFIDVRLGSLRQGTPGRFFEGGHPLDFDDLMRRNVVMEIEDVASDADKAFLIGTVLVRLYEHLRVQRAHHTGGLTHVTIVEEAHRLLRRAEPGTPSAHAVELFSALLAEVRAYGEGIVVAEQIPTKITPDLLKNTALKIVHRLPARDDRDAIGATMNLDDAQSRHVVTLPPGRTVVMADGMDRPVRLAIPLGEDRESGDRPRASVAASGRRSPSCGALCLARPCTLREMTSGLSTARDVHRLALWAELVTVSHVVGRPAPLPKAEWTASLTDTVEDRTLQCAVAHLTSDAAARRAPALVASYPPDDLARHVANHLHAHLAGAPDTAGRCDGHEPRWQAGPFRWMDVFDALGRGDHDLGAPHPSTRAWRERGLELGDVPATAQLERLHRLPSSSDTDRTAVDGTGTPPEHQRLATLLSRPFPRPRQRIAQAADFLTFSSGWFQHFLYPDDDPPANSHTDTSGGGTP